MVHAAIMAGSVPGRPLASVESMSAWTIVLAAGSGQRFGATKQFELLGDRSLVERTVATASTVSDAVVVVVPPGHRWRGTAVDAVVPGGATHGDSVRAGLAAVPTSVAISVVATASHPLASAALYAAVIDRVQAGADAAAPAISSADAIKRVRNGTVVESIDKTELRIVQAPSAFRADMLRRVLADVGEAPEELELIERGGGVVATVPGEATNVHIATPADLEMARRLVASP